MQNKPFKLSETDLWWAILFGYAMIFTMVSLSLSLVMIFVLPRAPILDNLWKVLGITAAAYVGAAYLGYYLAEGIIKIGLKISSRIIH